MMSIKSTLICLNSPKLQQNALKIPKNLGPLNGPKPRSVKAWRVAPAQSAVGLTRTL